MKELNKELVIPNSQNHVAEADDFIESNLETLGIDKGQIIDIAISTTELVNNAIIHGNKGDASKKVKIRLQVKNGAVNVDIIDQGKGFNPESIPDPLADENLLKEVGRGIFIARSLVDELEFDSEPGWGTRASIVKYLPGRNPQP